MKNIDKEMIKNIVNDLVFIENYKRYILRCDLEKLEENVKEYVINYISKTNIQVVDYEINRKNRTKSVDDYDYGYITGYGINHLDMPVHAKLEYNDNDDLIYEDYSDLDTYLENQFIPTYIFKSDKDNSYYIRLYDIVNHQFNEEEIRYVIDFFKSKEIFVLGRTCSLCGEFDNYVMVDKFKYEPSNKPVSEITNQKIIEYKNNPSLELRNEIILLNYNLVKYLAFKYSYKVNVSISDLESYGFEGLIRAIDNFDINNGGTFSNYAGICIRTAITQGISEFLGYGDKNFFYKFYLARRNIEKEYDTDFEGDIDLLDEIIELMVKNETIDYSNSDVNKRRILMHYSSDLAEYIGIYDDYTENCTYINCKNNNLLQDNLLPLEITNNYVSSYISKSLEVLTERELKVIIYSYGFYGNKVLNFREIGDMFGISRERVRVIHNDALYKLKSFGKVRYLENYIEEYDTYNYNLNSLVAFQNVKSK